MNVPELVSAALTNGSDQLRVHHNKLPRKGDDNYIPPMLVATTVTSRDEIHLRGDGGLRRYLIQLDAWAASRKFADDYMELARTKMLAATSFSIAAVSATGAEGYDENANLYRASLEFGLWVNL